VQALHDNPMVEQLCGEISWSLVMNAIMP